MLLQTPSTTVRATAARPYRHCVRIGEVSLAMSGASAHEVRLSQELEAFRAGCLNPDIKLKVEWTERLEVWRGEMIFDSGALWKVFRDDGRLVFDFTSPALSIHPYKRLHVDRDFRCAEVILSGAALGEHRPVFPLEYPVDELLVTNYLACGLGVEVHGCGLIDSETGGQLFLGHSGAGKSTTTMLWKSLRDPQILSDDRIILRLHDGQLWMYGTPWHGEAAFASAGRAKLSRIFILQHGDQNHIRSLPRAQAAGELFARSFPSFHNPAGLEHTLQFLDRVVDAVPCFEFQFVPDGSAVRSAAGFNG